MYTSYVVLAVIFVSYITTLVHVKRGSQYSAITGIIIQLIVSQAFGILTVLTFAELNIERGQEGGWAEQ